MRSSAWNRFLPVVVCLAAACGRGGGGGDDGRGCNHPGLGLCFGNWTFTDYTPR